MQHEFEKGNTTLKNLICFLFRIFRPHSSSVVFAQTHPHSSSMLKRLTCQSLVITKVIRLCKDHAKFNLYKIQYEMGQKQQKIEKNYQIQCMTFMLTRVFLSIARLIMMRSKPDYVEFVVLQLLLMLFLWFLLLQLFIRGQLWSIKVYLIHIKAITVVALASRPCLDLSLTLLLP